MPFFPDLFEGSEILTIMFFSRIQFFVPKYLTVANLEKQVLIKKDPRDRKDVLAYSGYLRKATSSY